MAPFERFQPFGRNAHHVLSLIDVAEDSELVKKTLTLLVNTETAYIAPILKKMTASDWATNPRVFETMLYYYMGAVRPLKAFMLELYARGGFTPEAREAWGRQNKKLLREGMLHRLDSSVPVPTDSECSVITLAFQASNAEVMAKVSSATPSYLTDSERRTILAAGEGEVWASLFGGMTAPLGSAFAYLILQAHNPLQPLLVPTFAAPTA